jgi:copper(I)-binding protein
MKASLLIIVLTFLVSSSHSQEIKEAWFKAPMPGMRMTAAYMKITNNTDKELVLEKVTGPDAPVYELHTHKKEKGVMKMRQVPFIKIPVGKTHELKPMSDHIMLMKMKREKFDKKETTLTLFFKDLNPVKIKVPVKKP